MINIGQFVMYNPQNYSCVTSLENIDFSMAKRLSIARDFVLPEVSPSVNFQVFKLPPSLEISHSF